MVDEKQNKKDTDRRFQTSLNVTVKYKFKNVLRQMNWLMMEEKQTKIQIGGFKHRQVLSPLMAQRGIEVGGRQFTSENTED